MDIRNLVNKMLEAEDDENTDLDLDLSDDDTTDDSESGDLDLDLSAGGEDGDGTTSDYEGSGGSGDEGAGEDDLGDEGDIGGGGDDLGSGGSGGGASFDLEGGDSEGEVEPEGTESNFELQTSQTYSTAEEKLKDLLKDTGDPDNDYNLSNPNNIRLENFKFVFSGIEPFNLLSEAEKKVGITVKEILDRLTPVQREEYYENCEVLRKKYPIIAEREKNIVIYNSNIPMYIEEDGIVKDLKEENYKEAYTRVDNYMTRRFGKHWQDLDEAREFLQEIKLVFNSDREIRQRLFSLEELGEHNNKGITPFNKIFVRTPGQVERFVREYMESDEYVSSSIFNSLSAAYKESEGTNASTWVVLGGPIYEENVPEEKDTEEDLTDEDMNLDSEGEEEDLDLGDETPDEGETGDEELDLDLEEPTDETPDEGAGDTEEEGDLDLNLQESTPFGESFFKRLREF